MSHASRRGLCILYAAGPGDVIGTYRHWKAGQDDPREVARTYSGQFFDVCRDLGARGYVITTRPNRQRLIDGDFIIEDRPVPGLKAGGIGYHLGQAAYGVRLALSAPITGASSFIIAAADTVMPLASRALMAQVFPDVPLSASLEGFQTLLSIDHARKHLGFEPQHSWRHTLTDDGRVR